MAEEAEERFLVKDILSFGIREGRVVVKVLWVDGNYTWEPVNQEIEALKCFQERKTEVISNSSKSLKEAIEELGTIKKSKKRTRSHGCGSCLFEHCTADELDEEMLEDIQKGALAFLQPGQASATAGRNSSSWRSMLVSPFNGYREVKYLHYCLQRAFNNAVEEEYLSGRDMFVGQAYRCARSSLKFLPSSKGDWRVGDLIHALQQRGNRFRLVSEPRAISMKLKIFFQTNWTPGRYILVIESGGMTHSIATVASPSVSYFVDDSHGVLEFTLESLKKYSVRRIVSFHEIQERELT
jgi:hypothetical protein